MAISALAVWNFDTAATGTAGKNGGFFVTGASGVNKSTQAGAAWALTTATSAGAGNVVLDASAHADMVGNGAFVVSGTNFTLNSWFEVTSVSAGVSITFSTNAAGTSICTGIGASGTINIGGANLLNSTLADDIFEAGTAGNKWYIKSGTYTIGETINIARAGGASNPDKIIGYTSTGDACTGASRPTLAFAAFDFVLGNNWNMSNVIVTQTTTTGVNTGGASVLRNCKIKNSGASSTQAITYSTDSLFIDCEIICYRGSGLFASSTSAEVINCWIHDCDIGYSSSATNAGTVICGNIIESCKTAAIKFTGATAGGNLIIGNTLFGSVNTTGVGIDLATGSTDMRVINNNISGFVTGVVHADTQSVGFDNFNNYHNNDTDVTNWTKGDNDSAVAPSFTSVGQVTGATATTTSGNHLVQAGATFITSGVTAGRDYVYIISGTGVTAGIYGILSVDSETQITADITLSANATADKVFQITTGHNFAIGTAMKALGSPGAFQGGYSTSYLDQGAVQRQESGGQKSYAFSG